MFSSNNQSRQYIRNTNISWVTVVQFHSPIYTKNKNLVEPNIFTKMCGGSRHLAETKLIKAYPGPPIGVYSIIILGNSYYLDFCPVKDCCPCPPPSLDPWFQLAPCAGGPLFIWPPPPSLDPKNVILYPSDVPMINYNRQLVVHSSNCDYRLQTSLIDCRSFF